MDTKSIEEYKKLRIGVDAPFRFHCTQCGKCYINREDILLSARDLYRIAQKMNLTPAEVIQKYGEAYIGNPSRFPIVRLKPIGPLKRCPLLDNNKCVVHDSKPAVCAMFPIGRMISLTPDGSFGGAAKKGIEYILTDPECGDASETHTVREWLGSFGIDLADAFFLEWSQILADSVPILQKLEKDFIKPVMNHLWDAVFLTLYLNYDTGQDFHPQFQKNVTAIKDLLRKLQDTDAMKTPSPC